MAEVLIRVTDAVGLTDEERVTIPVQPSGPTTGVEVLVLADPGASRDNFSLRVLGGFVVLTARSNGWYTVSRGGQVVVDRTLVDNRPDNTSARRPYWFRLKVQTFRGKRDIYTKVWPDAITQPDGTVVDFPEPVYWDSLWYQDADSAFLAAQGPTSIVAPGWVWQNLTLSDVPSPVSPVSLFPDRPNLADDFGIYHDGRDQSLELAAATRNLTGTLWAEPNEQYGIEQSVFLNDWHSVTLYGRAAEFVRSPRGIAQGVYLAFERARDIQAVDFAVRGAFQWRDTQVWFAPGIRTLDVQRARFSDFGIYNVAGDFALIRDGSVDVTLEGFDMRVAGRQGIAITNA